MKYIHGHNARQKPHPLTLKPALCKCGCGELVQPDIARGFVRRYKTGHHMRVVRRSGPLSGSWKGGRQKINGYVYVYAPDHPLAQNGKRVVAEHRMVIYDSGFPLTPEDHVHHINGDKTDNRLENLRVLSVSLHQRTHGYERGGFQPPTDRIATCVAWAREILDKYGHLYPAVT